MFTFYIYLSQDEKELIRSHVTQSGLGGSECVIGAEEYFNPNGQMSSQHTLSTPVETPLPPTPTQKFFPPGMTLPSDMMSHRSSQIINSTRHSRYGSNAAIPDGFSTLGSRRPISNRFSTSGEPLGMYIYY